MGLGLLSHVSFFVPGRPIQQGSKNLGRQGQMYDSAGPKLKVWRQAIGWACVDKMPPTGPFSGAIELYVEFFFMRPRSHLKKNGGLRSHAPYYLTSKPDLDKLVRAVLDGLSGAAYEDDSQVRHIFAEKNCVTEISQEGAQIVVVELREVSPELADEDSPDLSGLSLHDSPPPT